MTTTLGKLCKEWALEADRGNNQGVLRVDGVRYPRTLVRIEEGDIHDGVAAKLITKYGGAPTASAQAIAATRAGIESGNSWVFELIPRDLN